MQLVKRLFGIREVRLNLPLVPLPGLTTSIRFRRTGVAFVVEAEIPSKQKRTIRGTLLLRWLEAAVLAVFLATSGLTVRYRANIASHWLVAQWAPQHLDRAASAIAILAMAIGWLLAYWKRRQQFMYSIAEISFGIFSAFQVARVLWPNGEIAKFVALASAIYVVSRGVGNLNEALAKEVEIERLKLEVKEGAFEKKARSDMATGFRSRRERTRIHHAFRRQEVQC
jgi:hypothetical protein